MKPAKIIRGLIVIGIFFSPKINITQAANGAKKLMAFGHENCIELKNKTTRVILAPSGGRVLSYEINGRNTLYLSQSDSEGKGGSSAGRFDIGPERVLPRHELLWSGPYKGEITGTRSAKFTSGKDDATGFQIIREFKLASKGTHLRIKQTVINISDQTNQVCYWSRTFVHGQGICVVPVTEHSRMPRKHVIYENGTTINFLPEDEKITQRNGYVIVQGPPRKPKLGFDSKAGWMAYFMQNNLLFVKRWPTFPKKPYNEMAGLTLSIWYPDGPMCELEPIGPQEILKPGDKASFTEDWWITEQKFPDNAKSIDLSQLEANVKKLTNRK
ncbi:MAG: hypothetical protein CMO44_15385 [Verrucomicrobiales bacterium]|nr:hypothetical protein [Verrucomicrobiales bacterium]